MNPAVDARARSIPVRDAGWRPEPLLTLLEPVPACRAWAVTPYNGCDIRCRYCITGAPGVSEPRFPPDEVVDRLRSELDGIERRSGPVNLAFGGLSDAYPNAELRFGVTRLVIEELIARGRAFGIITKGSALRRDLELLAAHGSAAVTISLCTVDDVALAALDPGSPSVQQRLELIAASHAAGVPTSVSAAPWIPGVTDADALVEQVPAGVPVRFAPLNVDSPAVAATRWADRYDQEHVDRAYLAAHASAGERPDVFWSRPVRGPEGRSAEPMRNLDGSAILGRHSFGP